MLMDIVSPSLVIYFKTLTYNVDKKIYTKVDKLFIRWRNYNQIKYPTLLAWENISVVILSEKSE